ncbi:hypothetical protein [Desulfosediminicola sp.]|uniref:hypothetical protein n=1 Tax=Desulfosediminicola sp. TaxID=2886825 RepID=UPI003AF1E429
MTIKPLFYTIEDAAEVLGEGVDYILKLGASGLIDLKIIFDGTGEIEADSNNDNAFPEKNASGEIVYKEEIVYEGELVRVKSRDLMSLFAQMCGDASSIPRREIRQFCDKSGLDVRVRFNNEGERHDLIRISINQLLVDTNTLSSMQSFENSLENNVIKMLLDSEAKYRPEELVIALKSCFELYIKNPPKGKPIGGHSNYIKKWIKKNFPDLSNNACIRISQVINPDPKGGTPPTE